MEVWNNITLLDAPTPIAAPAAVQPTPLPISGWVNNGNSTEFDYTVTEDEMCAGGFTQNTTRKCGPDGTCGDADMVGVMTLRHDIANYPTTDVFRGDLLLINKPQFKRFEMHGSLPAAPRHGTVVSASKLHKQIGRRSIRQNMQTKFESRRAPEGGATTANTRMNTNKRYTKRCINK
jgi:hypothetical protein